MDGNRPQVLEQQARSEAEKKLQWIIGRYGDMNGERRKPYYLQQLIQEAKAAIAWKEFSVGLMELMTMDIKNAPVPTKATEA